MAVDRTTRWDVVRIYPTQTAANVHRILVDLAEAAPMNIARVLTDNRKAYTNWILGLRKRPPTGQHQFDQLCADFGIVHRLTPPMRPKTNAMVKQLTGRIEDLLQSHRVEIDEELEQNILCYITLYNQQLPQSEFS